MSNLLKSKFLLGAVMLLAFVVTTSSADAAITSTLKIGSKGAQVAELQSGLGGLTADGNFGPKTLAAVKAWQASKGLVADGVFGAKSRAAWTGGAVSGNFPAGCTSASGFSPTTGASCAAVVTTFPAGCTSASGFSSTTGASCATGVVISTGPVSVSLASTNPAAANIVDGQATADLTRFTFSGNGTVSSVTLKRSGISDSNALRNVYLYDGAMRLTDGYSFNTAGEMVMTNLGIAVNGTRTISVMADVASTASTNNATIAVSLTSYTTGASVNTVNIVGNIHSFVVGGSLASATLQANTVPTTASVNAGISAYTFWSAPLQVSTRSVQLKSAAFRMVGSAPSDAIQNIKLFVNGVDTGKVATVTSIQGSNYAMFDLMSAPITLTTGTQTIDVRGNVVKGSARTVQFSLQQAADLMLTDPQVGVNIAVLGTLPNAGGTISINAGSATLNLDPVFQAMTNITGGASNIAIGKFHVQAYGEDVKVNTLTVTPVLGSMTPTAAGLDDVMLYFNGSQVGTQQDWSGTGSLTFNLGSQMIALAGANSTLEVRANIRTATGNANYTAGTVAVTITAGTANAQGQNSLNTVSFPAGSVTGNTLTVQVGLLAVSRNTGYADQNISPNTIGARIGSFVFQNQSSSESVRVTSLNVVLSGTTLLTNLSALRTSETSGSGATPVQPQASNTFSVDFTLAPGATKIIDIFANTGTAIGAGSTLVATVSGTTLAGGVAAVTAIAQVNTAQLAGTTGTYALTVNGTTYTVPFNLNLTQTATDLAAVVNPDAAVNATGSGTTVIVTAAVAGTSFTITNFGSVPSTNISAIAPTTANTPGVANVFATGSVTVSGTPSVGDVITVTSGVQTANFITIVNSTPTTIATALAAAGSGFTHPLTSTGAVVTVTSTTAGVAGNSIGLSRTVTLVGGTSQSTLTVTSIGVSSNVSATSGATPGQIISLLAGAVTNPPTFTVSASSSAQFVAASGGAADATKAVYNFQSTNSSSVVTELRFTTTGSANAITSIKVAGVSAPVVGTVAYLTGLNLAVPQGGSGLNVDVFISYANVGTGGLGSGSTAGLNLTEVKFTSGGTTATFNPSAVPSNTMTLVGSKPTVALTLPNNASGSSVAGLSVGTRYVGDVRVTADAKGDVKVDAIALTFTGNAAGTTSNGGAIVVKDSTGTTITALTLSGTTGQNATVTINFTGGYTVIAGQTAVFKIELPVTGVAAGTGNSLATSLGANTTFTWTDTAGNGTVAGQNAALILNFPTASVSMTN